MEKMPEKGNQELQGRRAVLVGGNISYDEERFRILMEELESLAEACDMVVEGSITQNMDYVTKATFVGSGKVQVIKHFVAAAEADVVIFNETLSPMQHRNLSQEIEAEIMDRTGLILEIFSRRAKTREARLACEFAALEYTLPRLAGMRTSLGRQGGTSGSMSNRGLGEKKIELDRRHIERRLAELRRELAKIERERDTQRNKRLSSGMYKISLVGYTNSGKSTLLNWLLDSSKEEKAEKKVFAEDMLFATLDTVVRKISIQDARPFLLSDTVGFIDELPHTLVKAFRSTLEEVRYADLLLEVVDVSNPEYKNYMEVTQKTLSEIGAGDIPRIVVYNKSDCAPFVVYPSIRDGAVFLSAKEEKGLDVLLERIEEERSKEELEMKFLIPYRDMATLDYLNRNARVLETKYCEDGVSLTAVCRQSDVSRCREFVVF